MSQPPRRPRTLNDARTEAEAAFKQTTTKVPELPPKKAALPSVKELVSLRIDQDVLEHFQEGGGQIASAASMHSRPPGFYLLVFTGLAVGLLVDIGLPLSDLLSTPASAESMPFNCMILPGQEMASIVMTNSLSADASCIVTC